MRHGIVVVAFVLAAGLLLDGDVSAGSLEPPGPPAPTMKNIQEVEPRIPINSLPITIATNNGGDGIQASAANRIEDNEASQNATGIRLIGGNNLIVRNSVSDNTIEYVIPGGNKSGGVSTDPMTANPWANFDL